jgi:hypothetical protein
MTHVTEKQFNLYLDQALSSQELAAVDAHLAVCATCRAELEAFRSLFVALNTLPPDPLTDDLTPAVLGAVSTERQHTRRRRRLAWGVLGLQGLAIMLLLVFGWSNFSTQFNQLNYFLADLSPALLWVNLVERAHLLEESLVISGQLWTTQTLTNIQEFPTMINQFTKDLPKFSSIKGTTAQIAFIGLAAGLMWLIGNFILLRTNTHRSNAGRHSHQ